jgi:isoquinoline 1-oxidoreductase alpha subunit
LISRFENRASSHAFVMFPGRSEQCRFIASMPEELRMSYSLKINGTPHRVAVDGDTPLLWVLRDNVGLTGTKFACGAGICGACTVHIDGAPVRSCVMPVQAVSGRSVTTIEGLSRDRSHALQKAWVVHQVPQCGYCQSGMLMAAAALLAAKPKPSDADIDTAITNLCRCGTYPRIRAAIRTAAGVESRS